MWPESQNCGHQLRIFITNTCIIVECVCVCVLRIGLQLYTSNATQNPSLLAHFHINKFNVSACFSLKFNNEPTRAL